MASTVNGYRFTGQKYVFDKTYNITKAPADCDWSRWGMLHGDAQEYGGEAYRLYCFVRGTSSRLYQFVLNRSTNSFEFGYSPNPNKETTIKVIKITGTPNTGLSNTLGMCNNDTQFKLYKFGASVNTNGRMYEYIYDGTSYDYKRRLNVEITSDIDYGKMGMLYNQENRYGKEGTRLYCPMVSDSDKIVQFKLNDAGDLFTRVDDMPIERVPNQDNLRSFSLAFGQGTFNLYYLGQ